MNMIAGQGNKAEIDQLRWHNQPSPEVWMDLSRRFRCNRLETAFGTGSVKVERTTSCFRIVDRSMNRPRVFGAKRCGCSRRYRGQDHAEGKLHITRPMISQAVWSSLDEAPRPFCKQPLAYSVIQGLILPRHGAFPS